MKTKILVILLVVCSFNLYSQSRSEIIKEINGLLQNVKNVRIKTSDSSPMYITHTYMNFSEHASKKGWVSFTSTTSWGSGYEDLTLTYSFNPKNLIDISLNDEIDKERGNKAFLMGLELEGNDDVEVTSVQGGNTTRDKSERVVMYIMMKGSDGYEIYDKLGELFQKLYEIS